VALPILILRVRFPAQPYFLVVGVAGLEGHNWPVYYRFRGGRGFSVIFGSFVVIDWLGALVITTAGILLGMVVAGNPFLAYVSWLWLMIPWMWLRNHGWAHLAYAILVNIVFALAVIPEVRTYLAYGREGKLDGYREGLMASSPRWRGMKRMTDRLSIFRRR
jgi:glycerol-3-phosphate acyltransferase PlsY